MDETKARLFCKVGELAGASFAIDDEIVIGRHSDCSGQLEPVQMSNRHARIYFDRGENRFFLEDLDSLNGTELDGEAVEGAEPLGHLNVITFAQRFDFIFQDLDRCARRHERPAAAPAATGSVEVERTRIEKLPLPMPGVLEKLGRLAGEGGGLAAMETADPGQAEKTSYQSVIPRLPTNLLQGLPDDDPAEAEPQSSHFESSLERPPGLWLRVFLGEGEEQAFPLPEGEHMVGRESAADIRPASQEISRRHARFTVRGDIVMIEDLGSRNRTFLGGEEINGRVVVPLNTELRFGRVVCQVIHTGRSPSGADSGGE